MSAIWYTEKKKPIDEGSGDTKGLGFHKVLSKSRLFIDPRTQNVLNGLYALTSDQHISPPSLALKMKIANSIAYKFSKQLRRIEFHRENNTKVQEV